MSAEVVNLGKVRKARAKVAASAKAEANRAKFGRTKAERVAEDAAAERRDSLLDGARRDC